MESHQNWYCLGLGTNGGQDIHRIHLLEQPILLLALVFQEDSANTILRAQPTCNCLLNSGSVADPAITSVCLSANHVSWLVDRSTCAD